MEGGFIITSQQADAYSKDQPMTMKIRWNNSATVKEKIFFSLFRNAGVTYVIAEMNEDLSEFIQAGALCDIRSKGVNENALGSSFYVFVKGIQFSHRERIRRCNLLRNILYSKTKMKIRCCGPELESLLDRRIFSKSSEMVGLYVDGTYFSMKNVLSEKKYIMKIDDNLTDFELVDRAEYDSGQKKLAAVFDGFVMARNVIYIGSSPGISWLGLMDKFPLVTVYSFDPRPLVCEHPRVKHFRVVVNSVEDVISHIEPNESYDLIWDVRGDYIDETGYVEMIRKEIAILNGFLDRNKIRLVRINVKIHVNLLEEYFVWNHGRFFLMPFLLERDMNELRYVARVSDQAKIPVNICNGLRTWLSNVACDFQKMKSRMSNEELKIVLTSSDYCYSNFNLYLNSKLMRLDVANYVDIDRFDSEIDLNLFSINRNSQLQMSRYFEKSFPVVCTYFGDDDLDDDEIPLVDFECVNFLKYSIYDSRLFIKQMIPGLRIIVPKMIGPMVNELLTSESFRLQQSYDLILNRFNCGDYNRAKADAAKVEGFVYKKFPVPFSLAEEMISVSGHMMRFSYLCLVEKEVSFLTYCDKILSNFLNNGCIDSSKSLALKNGSVEWYPFEYKKCIIEKKSAQFWHSIPEWRAGLRALKFMLGKRYHFMIDKMIQQFNEMCEHFICKDKKGYELFDFMASSGSNKLVNMKSHGGIELRDSKRVFESLKESIRVNGSFNNGLDLLTPVKSKIIQTSSMLIKCFHADAAVRFVYIVFSFVSIISKTDIFELRNRYSEIFEWKRLTYISHLLFHKQKKPELLWSESDFVTMYECDVFPLFTFEWSRFKAEWKNDYYYLIRMLILLRGLLAGTEAMDSGSHWRFSHDQDWLTVALYLGLKFEYVRGLIVCNENMDDSLFSLCYDAENLYRLALRGLIYATP